MSFVGEQQRELQADHLDVRPWGNKVAVVRIEHKTTRGGIALPDTDDDPDKIHYGRVVAVGEGQYTQTGQLLPIGLGFGDVIAYLMDFEIEYNGQKVWLVNDDHVLALVESE